MLQRAARNAYSWWWASHIRTKQSKWLEDKLQDMEEKVEYILKIIDEDGDTFRQRAEMYYRKRPEIVSFVEDFFKGYRALAERYDHLSRELQSANRTIATVFPENVQLRMEDADEFDLENLLPGKMLLTPKTPPPAAPLLEIPKLPSFDKKKPKIPSRLMSRKGLTKIDANTNRSGLEKSEALERIDEIQKGILSLQTEKEFVKYSYEHGIQRYGEIEKQITEMQVDVSKLEDEFGIGTVIEDDEARSIMTATALRSCQETLSRLQHKQEESAEDAREELQKIQNAQEKIKFLKETHTPSPNIEFSALEQVGSIGVDVRGDVESLRRKVKEDLKNSIGNSFTMSELAEKVEELVDKIVKLESSVSSHGAYVQRLKLETKDLHKHLQSLEAEKEKQTSIEGGATSMNNKITKFEGELQRIQSLKQQMNEQNCLLQTGFAEASCNIEDLSNKLQNVKPDDEADIQETFLVNNVTNINEQCQMPSVESVTNVSSQIKDETAAKKEGNVNRSPIVSSDEREDKKGKMFVQNTRTLEEDQHSRFQRSNTDVDKGTEDEKNVVMILQSLNNMPENSLEKISTKVPDGSAAVLNGKDNKTMMQNGLQTTQTNFTADQDETVIEQQEEKDGSPNWKQMCLSDLDDRGRILLEEYTSVLRNYKEARKKLTEVEKNKRASLFRYCIQIKILESANALKDTEIESLQKKLSIFKDDQSQSKTEETDDHVREERIDLQDVTRTDETRNSSIVEERIRADIDELLDENIEFWMKFSSLLHQIRKFTTTVKDLQAEIAKVMEKKHQQNVNADHQSLISDIRPMYRHLSEIQTELTLWLDQNVILKDDLHNRSTSLSSIQEEITKMSKASEISVSGSGLIDYQAAKFHGEILNMNQENNRVVNELQSGLERVRNLQVEIDKTLKEVDKEFDISNRQKSRYTAIHTKIPLKSFLFGVKLKKQKPSFFACIHPQVQKKYSEISTLPQ